MRVKRGGKAVAMVAGLPHSLPELILTPRARRLNPPSNLRGGLERGLQAF